MEKEDKINIIKEGSDVIHEAKKLMGNMIPDKVPNKQELLLRMELSSAELLRVAIDIETKRQLQETTQEAN